MGTAELEKDLGFSKIHLHIVKPGKCSKLPLTPYIS